MTQFRKTKLVLPFIALALAAQGFADDFADQARSRAGDLAFGSYITAGTVQRLAQDSAMRERARETVRSLGLTSIYLEVYRSGTVLTPEELRTVRDFFREYGLEVIGGIATTPGGDVGVHQEGPLGWFNWQNEKTQNDLREIMRTVAPLFDTFIIDDFFCTGDVSAESRAAKGERSWGEYRRDLMVQVAEDVFLKPAAEANPDLTMILKYPQWYDRFHLHGYDTAQLPAMFNTIWVGTETRGARTQRFGFTQPYEGFVNYRWLADIAGPRIGGAWFDHGDCAEYDFLDQAYMSVLAGAQDLVFFNFSNLMEGHPDHAKIVAQFDALAGLAVHVKQHPAIGAVGYKPPNSDPGGDMYLMDFIGMLGIPLVPASEVSAGVPVLFLPTQAATDANALKLAMAQIESGNRLVVTTGFLAQINDQELTEAAGLEPPIVLEKMQGNLVGLLGNEQRLANPLDFASNINPWDAEVLLNGDVDGHRVPFLTQRENVFVLNTRTFDQADFDAVGEVLLCPRPLGILDLPEWAANELRAAFNDPLGFRLRAPARLSCHMLADGHFVIQNNNNETVAFELKTGWPEAAELFNTGADDPETNNGTVSGAIPPRGRIWLAPRRLAANQ